ncbi:MAG: hypothetical protein J0H27_01070 [Xanthomonadales bacterium]|nr:hypothetical protein [Xanthomonadales bacterium]ODU73145.1 MAG: hypothetical protein ABT17_13000 [Rhodanobacter sp. SCN 69-32]OJY82734.1 MAG: hypothetical protein BGP23_06375 [Xanthomonadales bacterium 66-474]
MDFRIADTFTESLARLAGDKQKTGKQQLDMQMTRASPGTSLREPETGRIAVKVINHIGDGVTKVFKVT